jgi:hypothetical protein
MRNPYERTVVNPKLMKFAIKAGLGLVISAAIGYAIKGEHWLDDRIDERYDEKDPDTIE